MNTIRELKQQEKYKSMLKRKNKEKKIYKDKNASLQFEKQKLYRALLNREKEIERLKNQLQQKENIIKEVREDLYQVVKWCTENKHNEDTIERYLVVDYGTTVGKINEIRTKLDKEVN